MTSKEMTERIEPLFEQIMNVMREAKESGLDCAAMLFVGALTQNGQVEMSSAGGGNNGIMVDFLTQFANELCPMGKQILLEAIREVNKKGIEGLVPLLRVNSLPN
jgi:hypothetical protein